MSQGQGTAAERLAQMIAIATTEHDRAGGEQGRSGGRAFPSFEALLRELYPLVHEKLNREEVTPFGLLYHWAGRSAEHPLVLMAHMDVVPVAAGDPWSHDPFGGEFVDGAVWGRGALDDKGALCAILEAVENLLREGFIPTHDIYLSFGADEETEGTGGKALAEELNERGIQPWMVLDEGGAVVDSPLPFVHARAAMIGVAEKGFVVLRLESRSAGGHASTPKPPTPISRISRAIRRLEARPFPPRMSHSGLAMLQTMLPHTSGVYFRLLQTLIARPQLGARVFAKLGGEPAALVRTTTAVTTISGGTADNVIPSHANATVNLRIAIGSSVAATVLHVKRIIADPHVSVTVTSSSEPTREAPADGPQFALLSKALEEAVPDAAPVPYIMLACSDARQFHRFTPATYRFVPFAMSSAQRASIHGVGEHLAVEALEQGVRFYATLIRSLPAGSLPGGNPDKPGGVGGTPSDPLARTQSPTGPVVLPLARTTH